MHFWQYHQKILQRQLKCWYKFQEFLISFTFEQILAMMTKIIGVEERGAYSAVIGDQAFSSFEIWRATQINGENQQYVVIAGIIM